MIPVTQRYIEVTWAAHNIQVSIWNIPPYEYVELHSSNDIPSSNINGNPQDKEPSIYRIWKEELGIYREVMSQVNIPAEPITHNERELTYKLYLDPVGEVLGVGMHVELIVGYKELSGPYAIAILYVGIDDDNGKDYAKTLAGYYPLPLPIDMEKVKMAIQPGLAYLSAEVRKFNLDLA